MALDLGAPCRGHITDATILPTIVFPPNISQPHCRARPLSACTHHLPKPMVLTPIHALDRDLWGGLEQRPEWPLELPDTG